MPKGDKPTGKESHRGVAPLIRKMSMDYPEMSKSDIARRAGCNPSTVGYVLQKFLGDTSLAQLRDFQSNKADVYDQLQMRFLESLTPTKLAKASALQAVTSMAILEDKARLIRGQATSINVNVLMDVVEAMRTQRAPEQAPATIDGQQPIGNERVI